LARSAVPCATTSTSFPSFPIRYSARSCIARITGARSPKLLHFNYNPDNGPVTLASYCLQSGNQEGPSRPVLRCLLNNLLTYFWGFN
jgi:hypothetical protein